MSASVVDDNDPRFTYKDNGWSVIQNPNAGGGSFHSGSTPGIVLTFGPFRASSIAVIGIIGSNPPTVHYEVDGEQNEDIKATPSTNLLFNQHLWTSSSLNPSQNHTLTVNVLDPGTFNIDAVELFSGSADTPQIPTQSLVSTPPSSQPIAPPVTPSSSSSTSVTTHSSATSPATLSPIPISSLSIPPVVETPSPTPQSPTTPASQVTSQPLSSISSSILHIISPTSSSHPSSGIPAFPSPSSSTTIGGGGMRASQVVGVSVGTIAGVAVVALLFWLCRRKRSRRNVYRSTQEPLRCNTFLSFLKQPLNLFSPEADGHSLMLPRYSGSETDLVPMRSPNPSGTSLPLSIPPQTNETERAQDEIVDISQRPTSGWSISTRGTAGSSRCHSNPFLSENGSTFIPPSELPPLPSLPPLPPLPSISLTTDSFSSISIPPSMTSWPRGRDSIAKTGSDLDEVRKPSNITVHKDAGVRLAGFSGSPLPTEELPPPYQSYHNKFALSSSSDYI